MELLQCESCGREFACGANADDGCWCAELAVAPQQLAVLREHFLACLCPDGLRAAAAEAAA